MFTVKQLMSTDVITVYPNDPVALVAEIMKWNDVNHIVVEDKKVTYKVWLPVVTLLNY